MKKILLFAICALSSLNLSAQWHVDTKGSMQKTMMFEVKAPAKEGDTPQTNIYLFLEGGDIIVADKHYSRLYDYEKDEFMDVALREEGKRVYALYDGEQEERLLYDFGLQVGESVDVGQHGKSHLVTVVDADTIYLRAGGNDCYARRLRISDETIQQSGYSQPAYWVEGIGSDLGPLHPYGWGEEGCNNQLTQAGGNPAFSYMEFFQVNPRDLSLVNDAPLWHVDQTVKEGDKEVYRTVWFYIPDGHDETIGGKTYKQLYYGIYSHTTNPEHKPKEVAATYLFGLREEGGRVYVNLEKYKDALARTELGNPDYLPYEVTSDGELVLYDFTMQEGDRFASVAGHDDVYVKNVRRGQFDEKIYSLNNGVGYTENKGAAAAAGMLVAYLNPPETKVLESTLAAYGKKGVYISYRLAAGGSDFVSAPDITNSINHISVQPVANAAIYDLSGRRVANSSEFQGSSKLPKGVYIQSGKKFVVK